MIVTFCGHGDIPASEQGKVRQWLLAQIENIIFQGGDTFYLGGYGDFDTLAASVVWELKQKHHFITSVMVIPYLNRAYDTSLYDETTYPPLETVPKRYAITKRNEWMVSAADVVIAYVKYSWGGAAKTLKLAQQKRKRIIYYES